MWGFQAAGAAPLVLGHPVDHPETIATAIRIGNPASWEQAIAARLVTRGSSEQEALLVPKVALACFQASYERWVRDPGQDLPALVDESYAALAGLAG